MRDTPNPTVNLTACKLRLQVPSALRALAAGYLQRYALERKVCTSGGMFLRGASSSTMRTVGRSVVSPIMNRVPLFLVPAFLTVEIEARSPA